MNTNIRDNYLNIRIIRISVSILSWTGQTVQARTCKKNHHLSVPSIQTLLGGSRKFDFLLCLDFFFDFWPTKLFLLRLAASYIYLNEQFIIPYIYLAGPSQTERADWSIWNTWRDEEKEGRRKETDLLEILMICWTSKIFALTETWS